MATQTSGTGKKRLIINAFVEMCMSGYLRCWGESVLTSIQVVAISRLDCGDTLTTNPLALPMLSIG